MIELEYAYYGMTKAYKDHDCDYGACRVYEFEHDGKPIQLGIYEDTKVVSILEGGKTNG